MEFIVANWEGIMAIIASILSIAAVIVKMTPTKKDDEILEKILAVFEVIQELKKGKETGATKTDSPGT